MEGPKTERDPRPLLLRRINGMGVSVTAGAILSVDCDCMGVGGDMSWIIGSRWVPWPERSEELLPISGPSCISSLDMNFSSLIFGFIVLCLCPRSGGRKVFEGVVRRIAVQLVRTCIRLSPVDSLGAWKSRLTPSKTEFPLCSCVSARTDEPSPDFRGVESCWSVSCSPCRPSGGRSEIRFKYRRGTFPIFRLRSIGGGGVVRIKS